MKIVFFGTPEFAVTSLDALVKGGHEIAAVVTATDKPAGRGHKLLHSAVKTYALDAGIPVLQPEKLRDPDFIKSLQEIGADLFVVIAFRMLPEVVWSMPKYGTFNLHASLLP
nr:methionyl-tRNA formyltransferase [Muribaculaceae bacterium]